MSTTFATMHLALFLLLLLLSAPTTLASLKIKKEREGKESTDGEVFPRNSKRYGRRQKKIRPSSKLGLNNSIRLGYSIFDSSPPQTSVKLLGDDEFTRRLKQEEERKRSPGQMGDFPTKSGSKTKASPLLHVGMFVLAMTSIYFNGSFSVMSEIISGSASALAIAWLPTLILKAGWIEIVSVTTLLFRPSVRFYIQNEFWPTMLLNVQRMVWADLWRKIWVTVLAPLPKPLFVPDPIKEADYAHLSPWMRQGFKWWNDMTDKFTQSVIRKAVEKNIHGTVGVFFESVSNSMLEVGILYDESMTGESSVEQEVEVESFVEPDEVPYCDGDTCYF